MKTCKRCGQTYSDVFFCLESYGFRQRKAVCIGCQLDERTTKKRTNRPREKARRTLRHHAEKYILLGEASSKNDFAKRYGWDLDQMAHDIKHAAGNGCPYCHEMFSEMGNGLSDITLDILNPELAPYYTTNTRWACATCNQAKRRLSPETWGEFLQQMKMWTNWNDKAQTNPYAGLPLLEGIISKGPLPRTP